jgi:hypothetical protein
MTPNAAFSGLSAVMPCYVNIFDSQRYFKNTTITGHKKLDILEIKKLENCMDIQISLLLRVKGEIDNHHIFMVYCIIKYPKGIFTL